MSVDITMPSGGFALVQGDTVGGQGLYTIPVHASVINEAVAGADPSNPRIDSVILEVLDNVHDAGGLNIARTRVVTGSPNAAATLGNRIGAPSLPASSLLLADLLVSASPDVTIVTADIRDRRKRARGAYLRIVRNANAAAGSDYTSTATSTGAATQVDATNLAPRIECSGLPLRVTLRAVTAHSAANARVVPELRVDGSVAEALYPPLRQSATAAAETLSVVTWDFIPTAGSRVLSPYLWGDAGTSTLWARSTAQLEFTVEEIVRESADSS